MSAGGGQPGDVSGDRWRVALVTEDALLVQRIRQHLKRRPDIELSVFELPDRGATHASDADLLILPGESLPPCVHAPAGGATEADHPPVVAYGPAALLRRAFLGGAADYLRDPWSPEELLLRMDRLLRDLSSRRLFRWGPLSLTGDCIHTSGGTTRLSHQEAVVLRALLRHRGGAVSREALFYLLWGAPPRGLSRAVDMHVSSLNRKIRTLVPEVGRLIRAVRGVGYTIP